MMNKIKELENKIKELSEELERLKAGVENKQWKPEEGEDYWFIPHDGKVRIATWFDDRIDVNRYGLGNVYKTKAEADFRVEQLKVEAELRRFSRPFEVDGDNYTFCFNHHTNNIYTRYETHEYEQFTNLHFDSEERAQQAIDTVGEERIKKYYFGVKE